MKHVYAYFTQLFDQSTTLMVILNTCKVQEST